jgi:hypothetical protein
LNSEEFQSALKDIQPTQARVLPLGKDSFNKKYYWFGYDDFRIYREESLKPTKQRSAKKQKVSLLPNDSTTVDTATAISDDTPSTVEQTAMNTDEATVSANTEAEAQQYALRKALLIEAADTEAQLLLDSINKSDAASKVTRHSEDLSDDVSFDVQLETEPLFILLTKDESGLRELYKRLHSSRLRVDKDLASELKVVLETTESGEISKNRIQTHIDEVKNEIPMEPIRKRSERILAKNLAKLEEERERQRIEREQEIERQRKKDEDFNLAYERVLKRLQS